MLGQFFCPLFRVTGTPVHLSENLFGFVGTLWGPLWEVVWKWRGLPWKLVWNVGCRNSLKCDLFHLLHVSSLYLQQNFVRCHSNSLLRVYMSQKSCHTLLSAIYSLPATCDIWQRCVEGKERTYALCCSVLQCVAVCCSVLQCVAVCCRVLQCVAVCCSVVQCVAVCCNVLQWHVPQVEEIALIHSMNDDCQHFKQRSDGTAVYSYVWHDFWLMCICMIRLVYTERSCWLWREWVRGL